MAQNVEERFPGIDSVGALAHFLKSTKHSIWLRIQKGEVKDSKKAQNFVALIEEVLELPYFDMDVNVYGLMGFLKEDGCRFKEQIVGYKKELAEAKERLETIIKAPEIDGTFVIPDEWKELHKARESQIAEARQDVYSIQSVIDELEHECNLIHRLKGMICRPKGFFAKL